MFPKPWSVQIELTEGCNRRCSFCGIHSIYREKIDMKYKFMSLDTARRIARDLNKWLGKIRIEFAMQGEPLLNPDAYKIFNAFRLEFPRCQIMVTSNTDPLRSGDGFDGEKIAKLFQSGVNILVADYYGEKWDMPYADFKNALKTNKFNIPVYDFYDDKPKVWAYVGNNIQYIVAMDNTQNRNFFRTLNNQAGNLNPDLARIHGVEIEPLPMMKRCHLPFREMAIKHDGSVAICCMDWQREGIMGKFPEMTYEQIWNSEPFNLVRAMLYEKRRDLLNPCDRCNYHPVKVGLISEPSIDRSDIIQIAKRFRKHQQSFRELANKYADKPFRYQ
jgi:radical SAM protein with 4Fe4S-binding SPASM domain